jgi:hypothetical protein
METIHLFTTHTVYVTNGISAALTITIHLALAVYIVRRRIGTKAPTLLSHYRARDPFRLHRRP